MLVGTCLLDHAVQHNGLEFGHGARCCQYRRRFSRSVPSRHRRRSVELVRVQEREVSFEFERRSRRGIKRESVVVGHVHQVFGQCLVVVSLVPVFVGWTDHDTGELEGVGMGIGEVSGR